MSEFIPLKVNKEGTRGSFYCVLVLGEMFQDKKFTEENVLALCRLAVSSLETFHGFFLLLKINLVLTETQAVRARALPGISLYFILFIFLFCYFYFYFNFQAQPIPSELTAKLLGNRVAVSPIVTIEPRRRKFHKPITLTIPVPVAASKGMINQYNGDTPTLRLLCSITGRSEARLAFTGDSVVYFTLGVSSTLVLRILLILMMLIILISYLSIKSILGHLPLTPFKYRIHLPLSRLYYKSEQVE